MDSSTNESIFAPE